MKRPFNHAGIRYGKLVALRLSDVQSSTHSSAIWECQCDCGKVKSVRAWCLVSGKTRSCGCLLKTKDLPPHKSAPFRPSLSRSPEYGIWSGMLRRCRNPKDSKYKYYGGAGVTVCEKWSNDFFAFLSDMGLRPSGMSIGRIRNAEGYSPGNCRWESSIQQASNRRNTRYIAFDGQTKCLAEWARITGIHQSTLWGRLQRGLTVGQALNKHKED